MREVVYFDSNPSVKALIAGKLKRMGLRVILPKQLNEIEQALQTSTAPDLLIVDLSREPQFLRALQSFVSQYIPDPKRCILTSIRPTALAHYLPADINRCFFRHVVERPFKTPEFMALIESEFPPGTLLTNSNSCIVNSSVDQITLPPHVVEHAEDKERVNEIMRSISLPISISEGNPNEQPSAMNHESRRPLVVSPEQPEKAPAHEGAPVAEAPVMARGGITELPPLGPDAPRLVPANPPIKRITPSQHAMPPARASQTAMPPAPSLQPVMPSAPSLQPVMPSASPLQPVMPSASPLQPVMPSAAPLQPVIPSAPPAPLGQPGMFQPLSPPRAQAYTVRQDAASGAPVQPGPLPALAPLCPPEDPRPHVAAQAELKPSSEPEPDTRDAQPHAQSTSESQPAASRPIVPNRISRKHGHITAAQPQSNTSHGGVRQETLSQGNSEVRRQPLRSAKATLDAIRGNSASGSQSSKDNSPRVASRVSQHSSRAVSSPHARPAHDSIHDVFTPDPVNEHDEFEDVLIDTAEPDQNPVKESNDSTIDNTHTAESVGLCMPASENEIEEQDDDGIEHTMLISPDIMTNAVGAIRSSLRLTSCTSGLLSVYVWSDILRRSCLTGERVTLEIGNSPKTSLVVIDMGSALWAESCSSEGPKKLSAYLKSLPDTYSEAIHKLESALHPGDDPATTMMQLGIYNELIPVFEKTLTDTLKSVIGNNLISYKYFDGLSKKADALLKDRIPLNIPVAPFIFERCREMKLPLGAKKFRKFRARPDKSPLNAAIQLNELEKTILSLLSTPQTCDYLDAALNEDAASILPRLILFDFVDICA